jgi:hypothetical protein
LTARVSDNGRIELWIATAAYIGSAWVFVNNTGDRVIRKPAAVTGIDEKKESINARQNGNERDGKPLHVAMPNERSIWFLRYQVL